MRASTPLAARQQQALVATSEAGAIHQRQCRRQPSPSSPAIDLASARRRSSCRMLCAVPSAKATSSSTTTTSSPASEESTSSSSHSPSSAQHEAATADRAISTPNSRPISLDQLPCPLRDSVIVLSAPNPQAPGGQTPVYVLGVSHVSKTSLDRVRLIFFLTPTTPALSLFFLLILFLFSFISNSPFMSNLTPPVQL